MATKVSKYSKSYFISCPVGLEEALSKEITDIGASKTSPERGGISFSGPDILPLKTILYSRIGSRVYKKLFSFPVVEEKDIHKISMNLPWTHIFGLGDTFKVKCLIGYGLKSHPKQSFKNSVYISQLLKDGICDHFRKKFNQRPSVDKDNPTIGILIRIAYDEFDNLIASLYLDLCGDPIHNRNYRKFSGKAPLRENLAAGIISYMDWNPNEEVFIDSMCGSGTFLIEAALIKGNIPPSYLKILSRDKNTWAFQNHTFFRTNQTLMDEFEDEIKICNMNIQNGFNKLQETPFTIFGSDIDSSITKQAIMNLKVAKLTTVIKIVRKDAINLTPQDETKGVIFCNPPYGERIGDVTKLESLYHDYGENLKKSFNGFRAYIFTGNLKLRKKISLQTSKRVPLFNGPIDCRLLKYDLY
jgi:23S rRNA G2445 N2-methylase RlmL